MLTEVRDSTGNVGDEFDRALQVAVRQDRFGNWLEIGGVTKTKERRRPHCGYQNFREP